MLVDRRQIVRIIRSYPITLQLKKIYSRLPPASVADLGVPAAGAEPAPGAVPGEDDGAGGDGPGDSAVDAAGLDGIARPGREDDHDEEEDQQQLLGDDEPLARRRPSSTTTSPTHFSSARLGSAAISHDMSSDRLHTSSSLKGGFFSSAPSLAKA